MSIMANTSKNGRYEVGNILRNTFGTEYEIIEKLKNPYRKIKFRDSRGYECIVGTANMCSGTVKNPYDKTFLGIGYLGECISLDKSIYSLWASMMNRCYNEHYLKNRPTYVNAKVHDDWHNFSNFQSWVIKTKPDNIKNISLDKDLLNFKSNSKLYHEDKCLWVTREINNSIKNLENSKNIYFTKSKKYETKIKNIDGCVCSKTFYSYTEAYEYVESVKYNILSNIIGYLNKINNKDIKITDILHN